MVKCCKNINCRRLRCSDFDLTPEDPSLFIKSQLPVYWGHWIAVVWNLAWCAFFTAVLFVDIFLYTMEERHLWPLFLSNWAFMLTISTTCLEGIVRLCMIIKMKTSTEVDAKDMHWCQKVQWAFYNTSNVVSLMSTIIYFSVSDIGMSLPCVSKNIIASVYVILNTTVISSLPVKLLHFYQSTIFLIFYAIFISIYQRLSKRPMDLVLDWNQPQRSTVVLICALTGTLLLHLVFYCAFRLRSFIFKKCSNVTNSRQSPAKIQRDITATDVILDYSGSPDFIDVRPDVKDDITLKTTGCANGDAFKRFNGRLYKSETDLRDYRLKNGLFCEFAKSSLKFHKSSSLKTTRDIFGDNGTRFDTFEKKMPEKEGSQIIVVKEYKCHENSDEGSDVSLSDRDSNASSDYLSQYISEDILAYL